MKKFCAYLLLSIFSSQAFAETPLDDSYQLAVLANTSSYFMIEQGNLKDASGYLFNPVCTGHLQSPALITELSAFFAGHEGARVIDRGDGHYLLLQKQEIAAKTNLQKTARTLNTAYAELEFSSGTEGSFTIRATATFFTDSATGTSTCLAKSVYELNRVKS